MEKYIHILAGIFFSIMTGEIFAQSLSCKCDTIHALSIIDASNYNRIPKYDAKIFTIKDFYKLNETDNRLLWFRDIENIDSTKFTSAWNDYAAFNYHVSPLDFLKYYENKPDVELAFIVGPNSDLWAYHIFVVKKIGCCYVITRSYFRHARFTYKAYSIINSTQLDSLYAILEKGYRQTVIKDEAEYCGYFMDNRNRRKFFLDAEMDREHQRWQQLPKSELMESCEFVDTQINWTVTYSL